MEYDLIVIGGGPAGGSVAVRSASYGAKVCIIEENALGGICLNKGCIPTKALIASAKKYINIKKSNEFGINVSGDVSVDFEKVQERKNSVVEKLKKGLAQYYKSQKIEIISGRAKVVSNNEVSVNGNILKSKKIVIATGSKWKNLPHITPDGHSIVTSDEALNWTKIPDSILIIGAGAIGCEFGCMLANLGSKVTIVEALNQLLPSMDEQISKVLARNFKKLNISVLTSKTVTGIEIMDKAVKVKVDSEEIVVEKVMVAVGRAPLSDNLGLENLGVQMDRGFIKVDGNFMSSVDGIYAIGDVIGNPMLAHKGSNDGDRLGQILFGNTVPEKPKVIPAPVFTIPEVSSVGLTSAEIQKQGIEYNTARFYYMANGKAHCDGEEEGLAVFYSDKLNGKILGAHIFGSEASILTAEIALAIEKDITAKELASVIHAHPTLSEIVSEGMMEL